MQSVGRQILSSALTVGLLNGVVMVAAVVRDLAFAHRFGTGEIVDSFLMGLLIPTIAVQIIAMSLSLALIPEIIRTKSDSNPGAAAKLSSAGLFAGITLLGIASLVLLAAYQPVASLLNAGSDDSRAQLTTFFYLGLLPCIMFQGWSIIAGCLLNAVQRFATVAVSPVLRPLAVCVAIFVSDETNAAAAILTAYLGGAIAEAGWITFAAIRARVLPVPKWFALNPSLRKIAAEFGMVVLGTGILSVATLADQYIASLDGLGGVATYGYGTKIISVLIGAGALPLGAAVLPHFSEQVRERKWEQLRFVLLQWTAIVLIISVPAVVLIWAYSVDVVQIIFQRGAFSADDTQRVAVVQKYLALQIPFYLCGILYVRALISLQRNWVVALIAIFNAVINIGGSLILVKTLGVGGIALAATIGYIVANVMAGGIVFHLIHKYSRAASSAR